jgi:hypothetical protein
MRRTLLSIAGVLTAALGSAQTEGAAWTATGRGGVATTFVTDYQAAGINPANLGWNSIFEDKHFTLGMLEGSYSLYSEALAKPQSKDLLKSLWTSTPDDDLTYAEKIQAGQDFTSSGFAVNVDIQSIGMALITEKAGGFAFGIKDRFSWYSKLNETTSDILWLGYNAPYFDDKFFIDTTGLTPDTIPTTNPDSVNYASASVPNPFMDILDGSEMRMTWLREYNFSYGKQVIGTEGFSLHAGFGIKYIQGLGIMEISSENGELTAFSALSPGFEVDYGTSASGNPSNIEGAKLSSVGDGIGMDFGVSAIIGEKLKLGFSIVDIGTMTWDGNVYEVQDTILIDLDQNGMDNFALVDQATNFVGQDGLLSWEGVAEKEVKLPTLMRLGASYRFGDAFEAGVDLVIPGNEVPGNLEQAVFAFGGDLKPAPWLRISAGFVTGGNYGFNLPVGITLFAPTGGWEGGIASRDMVTFFSDTSPTLSLATGFMRFRF